MLFCPQCSLILEAVDWSGAAIHACRSCGGCWMAGTDFDALLAEERSRFRELDQRFPSSASAAMFEGLPKPCPACRTITIERRTADSATNPLACPKCGGVWLQAGEPGLRDSALPAEPDLEPTDAEPDAEKSDIAEPRTPESRGHADGVGAVDADVAGPSDSVAFAPDAMGSPPAVEPAQTDGARPAVPAALPWLPPVATAMPDPRPLSARGRPLMAEPVQEEAGVAAPVVATQRWCPQCRCSYAGGESECAVCAVGLAESTYRVRCLRCGSENTISAERCWSCQAKMHPDCTDLGTVIAPPLPSTTELRRLRGQAVNRPSVAASCGTSVLLWVLGGSVGAGLLMLLLER